MKTILLAAVAALISVSAHAAGDCKLKLATSMNTYNFEGSVDVIGFGQRLAAEKKYELVSDGASFSIQADFSADGHSKMASYAIVFQELGVDADGQPKVALELKTTQTKSMKTGSQKKRDQAMDEIARKALEQIPVCPNSLR